MSTLKSQPISCPHCGGKIEVDKILRNQRNQIEDKLKEENAKKMTQALQKVKKESKEREEVLKKQASEQNKKIRESVRKEKAKLKDEIEEQFKNENEGRIFKLKEELEKKSEKIVELNEAKAKIEILKRNNKEIESKAKQENEQKMTQALQKVKEESKEREEALKKQVSEQNKKIRESVRKEKAKLKDEIEGRIKEEHEEKMSSLKNALEEKSKKVKEFHKLESENEVLKFDKEEMENKLKAENAKKMTQALQKVKDEFREQKEEMKKEIQQSAREKYMGELEKKDYEIKRAKKKLDDIQLEQGSSQTLGEVQEIAMEEWLKNQFPLDVIEEIKKGEKGADCLQKVNTHGRLNCGTIYYESKCTKKFQQTWIEKFKKDMREKNADVGVLVTKTMPDGMEKAGMYKKGIWICSFDEFKILSIALRELVIRVSREKASQENKGEKMQLLYNFLTSEEFRMQVEAIEESFSQMKIDLESEKRSMQRIWNKREKQIERVLINKDHMHGSINGIAGKAIKEVKILNLPSSDEENNPTEETA